MADKRISQLIERVDIANNDVLPIVASGATTTNKVTISTIQDWMQSNLDVGVTSVGLTMPSAFQVSGSPITTSGNINVTATGTASQYIRGDGSLADFPQGGGGGASVSYYLNGSVSQGTIGGIAYLEMNKTPILGAGTDFTISSDGYIASFITDAGDPALLQIPAGNWNFETYLQASSGGGTPTFYIELYKVDSGGTATLIASNSGTPELIAFGTTINPYFSALAVPQTTLALTDRLALRYYVSPSGRTITLHTENNTLCQIITTFTTGLTALNGLTAQVQNFATGTSGTNFGITSSGSVHTFNLPDASASARGVVTTGSQVFAGVKTFADGLSLPSAGGTNQASRFVNIGTIHQGSGGSNQIGFNNSNNIYFGKGLDNGGVIQWSNSAVRYYTLPNADGTLALTSDLGNYVPYTGATSNVDLGSNSLSSRNLIANGGLNTGALLLKNANQASLINTGYFTLTPSSTTTSISFGYSTGANTWKSAIFSSHLLTDNTPTVFSLPNGGGTLALTSDLGGYLPLTGGTLTGALNGTSANFNDTLIASRSSAGASVIVTNTGVNAQLQFANNTSQSTIGIANLGSGAAANTFYINTSLGAIGSGITMNDSGAVTLAGALNGTSASFTGSVTSTGFRTNATNGYILRNDGNNLNLGGLTRRGFWAGGTAADTQIFAETGYSIFINPGGSSSIGLTLAPTGAATFSSSVTVGGGVGHKIELKDGAAWPTIRRNTSTGGIIFDTEGSSIAGSIFSVKTLNGSDFVTVTSGGNVGIGTPSPTGYGTTLQIASGSSVDSSFVLGDGSGTTTNRYFAARPGSSGNLFFGTDAGDISFRTGLNPGTSVGTERMRITSGGNVNIAGSPSSNTRLTVSGVDTTSSNFSFVANSSSQNILLVRNDGNVGINVNPTSKLHVVNNADGFVGRFTGGSASNILCGIFGSTSQGFASIGVQSNHGFRLFTNDEDRLVVTSGGNVGIGTTTAASALSGSARVLSIVDNTTANVGSVRVYGGGTATSLELYGGASAVGLFGSTDHPMTFSTNSTERMRITSGGYLKASNTGGYQNNTGPFHEFNQNSNGQAALLLAQTNNSNPLGLEVSFPNADPNNATNYVFAAYTTSGAFAWIYRIFSNGTVSARSDARWKKNIETTRDGYIDDLCKLRVVKYNWYNHEDDAPKELGLIAQEVEEVFPGLVQQDPVIAKREVEQEDGTIIEEEYEDGVSRSIKTSVLPFMLLKAMQEQQEQIKELRAEIEALKSQING